MGWFGDQGMSMKSLIIDYIVIDSPRIRRIWRNQTAGDVAKMASTLQLTVHHFRLSKSYVVHIWSEKDCPCSGFFMVLMRHVKRLYIFAGGPYVESILCLAR